MRTLSKLFVRLLFCLVLVGLTGRTSDAEEINLSRVRTEGRLTMTYEQADQTSIHDLAFAESIDSVAKKSAISIGYVSHAPEKFYKFGDSPIIALRENGKCASLGGDIVLVPSISWLINLMLPNIDLKKYRQSGDNMDFVGPTGIIQLFTRMMKSNDLKNVKIDPSTKETHRNVLCNVLSETFQLPGKDFNIHVEILMPVKGIVFRSIEETYFTVRVKSIFEDPKATISNAGFVIDFFNIELLDNQAKLDKLNEDFNIPLGKGCSEFLTQIMPEVKSWSFSMGYTQLSSLTPKLMAYDHSSGFLRKENVGVSVSIWDLNEDLLYYIDKNVTQLIGTQEIKQERTPCSVLQVDDPKLGPAYHPYEKVSESLDVLQLIGASQVAYMGFGTVRELPCYIYETILAEPPVIFGLTEEELMRNSAVERDFIVQYYLLRGEKSKPDLELDDEAFFPAKIVLLKRTKSTGAIEFIDQLDIYEFYWSLDGWNKKGAELFMASECFDDEAQQLRLELAIVFDRVHGDLAKEEDKTLLAYNKFKLEFDLINNILEVLSVRRTHLVRYEMKLRPNHVNLDMVIADRSDNKDLRYFGTGTLASTDSYERSRVVLNNLNEESCISIGSLIVDISMVVYCPHRAPDEGSSCIAVYGEREPTVKNYISTDANLPNCQVYRYNFGALPHQATYRLTMNKFRLFGHQLDFVAKLPWSKGGGTEMLKGTIKDYEISHEMQLLTVDHYAYALDSAADSTSSQNIRSFESISYNNIGDCIRMCNLDASCKSYSYCSSKSSSDKNRCHLSTLDIRSSNIQTQLVHAPNPSSGPDSEEGTVTVVGDRGRKYRLKFEDQCNIYERDYLSLFRQTDEVIRLSRSSIHQFQTAPSTFECAKQSVDLELSFDDHHVAMFAYCGSDNLCILDESLFAPTTDNATATQNGRPAPKQQTENASDGYESESLCNVYRKKYQTYFDVSGQVLKQGVHQGQQVEFSFNTVEECARACWNQFGQVCSSFDFCSPGSCLINQLSARSDDTQLESRSGCLHYERDLKWDKLRKEHLIGRHAVLERQGDAKTFSGFLWNLATLLLVSGSFIYGLVVGRQISDKLESVTVLMQSISYGRGPRGSRFFGESQSVDDESSSGPRDDILDASDEVNSTTNAIRMDVIKRNTNELDQSY